MACSVIEGQICYGQPNHSLPPQLRASLAVAVVANTIMFSSILLNHVGQDQERVARS